MQRRRAPAGMRVHTTQGTARTGSTTRTVLVSPHGPPSPRTAYPAQAPPSPSARRLPMPTAHAASSAAMYGNSAVMRQRAAPRQPQPFAGTGRRLGSNRDYDHRVVVKHSYLRTDGRGSSEEESSSEPEDGTSVPAWVEFQEEHRVPVDLITNGTFVLLKSELMSTFPDLEEVWAGLAYIDKRTGREVDFDEKSYFKGVQKNATAIVCHANAKYVTWQADVDDEDEEQLVALKLWAGGYEPLLRALATNGTFGPDRRIAKVEWMDTEGKRHTLTRTYRCPGREWDLLVRTCDSLFVHTEGV